MNARACIVAALLVGTLTVAAQPKPPADAWVSGAVLYPLGLGASPAHADTFASLRAELLTELLKVRWQPTAPVTHSNLLLHFSADAPGHWPARDWQTLPFIQRGVVWEATLPVDDLDVPLVYFVSAGSGATALLSPMRVVSPRLTGMEKPSRIFWPFLDGFETGISAWELSPARPDAPPLARSPVAHDGNAALSVTLPAGQRSVTVGTTRVRGWHYSHEVAAGLRVWLRAPGGTGRARFFLHSNHGTTNEVTVLASVEVELDDKWRKVDLAFSAFPNFPVVGTDWFSIEFSSAGPREFLVDDLRLLGRWKLPGD